MSHNKYQAHIRHINGDIITSIWDNNKKRFNESCNTWQNDFKEELNEYDLNDLYLEIV
jgi:hypothetical protein